MMDFRVIFKDIGVILDDVLMYLIGIERIDNRFIDND